MTVSIHEAILNTLKSDTTILQYVASSSILRGYPREAITLPAIIVHQVDSYSTPPLGYAGDPSKERLETTVIQVDVLSDKSRYEADTIRDAVVKCILTSSNLSAEKISAPEDYDDAANVYISRVRFRVKYTVNDV